MGLGEYTFFLAQSINFPDGLWRDTALSLLSEVLDFEEVEVEDF